MLLQQEDSNKELWHIINADNTIENIHNEIINIVNKVLFDIKLKYDMLNIDNTIPTENTEMIKQVPFNRLWMN
jgi:hypothetical protein